jgi:rubrerythrin
MKRFFALFLTFFIVSLLALGAAYIDGKMRPQYNEEHLWHDTLQHLNELGRQQHQQSIRYRQYAIHAQQAQEPQIATLFRAMAFVEEIKCENCKDVIGALGGVFNAPIETSTPLSSVIDHLHTAIKEKQKCHEQKMQGCIARAINEDNRYLARMLTWCDASDVKMILIMQQAIKVADTDYGPTNDEATYAACYWVCPNCGNIECEQLRTCYCPHCMTYSAEFLIFE